MYVWRKKNRRDRRDLLTSGAFRWRAPANSVDTDAVDEVIRGKNEETFVNSLITHQRKTIFKYLNTKNGSMEVNHVIHEIELLEQVCVYYI